MARNTTYEAPAKFGWVLEVESPINVSRVPNGNLEQVWRRGFNFAVYFVEGRYLYLPVFSSGVCVLRFVC